MSSFSSAFFSGPCVCAALLLGVLASTGAANAATVSLQPSAAGSVVQGNQFQIGIYMDFSDDPTIGGGFDLIYDAALVSYVSGSFRVADALGSDPAFTRDDNPASSAANRVDVDAAGGKIIGAAFGDFIGLTGPSLVGSLTFLAANPGLANFALAATQNPLVGNFISTFTLEDQAVNFTGTSLQVSQVPVPAAAWLLLSGLAGVAGLARRKAA